MSTIRNRLNDKVPEDVLIPAANELTRQTKRCADSWTDTEQQQLKKMCGPPFAHMSVNEIARQAISLRKGSKLLPVKGHGPGKPEPISAALQAYYKTPKWCTYRQKVGDWWGWRCAICMGKGAEVHHRTYVRLYVEMLTDCILLCHNCHKAADIRRRRAYAHSGAEQQEDLF